MLGSDQDEPRFVVDGSILVPSHSIYGHNQGHDAVDPFACLAAIGLAWFDVSCGILLITGLSDDD
jgi:hypothetical protein